MLPDGVWHWTATHPEWDDADVSCYAIDTGDQLVLVDPLAVPDDVAARADGREVVVLLTNRWHERDARSAAERFGAAIFMPPTDSPKREPLAAETYLPGDRLPFGAVVFDGREPPLDAVLWFEGIRAVVSGDTLIDVGGGLEIRESWLPDGVTREQVVASLRPLLDLPVEHVLPTHGEPLGRDALERALS